jgi:predicted peptidase
MKSYCASVGSVAAAVFAVARAIMSSVAFDVSSFGNIVNRRDVIITAGESLSLPSFLSLSSDLSWSLAVEETNRESYGPQTSSNRLNVVTDPDTFSALAYAPQNANENTPLILVLHGSGRNDKNILDDLASPVGEHAGLIPSLLEGGNGPQILQDQFCVLAPYSFGQASFYNEPRDKLLRFVDWAVQYQNTDALPIRFDPKKIILFGFSDGATVAVELLTTRRFAAGVICSYGYSGQTLPSQALERLANIPIWVFHSKDDVIFNVHYSDRLVRQLKSVNVSSKEDEIIRFSRFDTDPENLPPRVRGHSMGIVASKDPKVFEWMLRVAQ